MEHSNTRMMHCAAVILVARLMSIFNIPLTTASKRSLPSLALSDSAAVCLLPAARWSTWTRMMHGAAENVSRRHPDCTATQPVRGEVCYESLFASVGMC